MLNPLLAEEVRYLKETQGGNANMSEALELIAKEYAKEEVERAEHEKAVSTALNLLAIGTLSVEDIARCVGLPVEEVKSLTDKKPA